MVAGIIASLAVFPTLWYQAHVRACIYRLKAEGFQGKTMRDYTGLRAVESAIEPRVVEGEKVLNSLGFVLCEMSHSLQPSTFSLNT
jgi:hypothetical protein